MSKRKLTRRMMEEELRAWAVAARLWDETAVRYEGTVAGLQFRVAELEGELAAERGAIRPGLDCPWCGHKSCCRYSSNDKRGIFL